MVSPSCSFVYVLIVRFLALYLFAFEMGLLSTRLPSVGLGLRRLWATPLLCTHSLRHHILVWLSWHCHWRRRYFWRRWIGLASSKISAITGSNTTACSAMLLDGKLDREGTGIVGVVDVPSTPVWLSEIVEVPRQWFTYCDCYSSSQLCYLAIN